MIKANILLALRAAIALCLAACVLVSAPASAQQPADLAHYSEVQPGDPTYIDGVWRIEATGKRILIENGHGFALDRWVHLFLWEVQPGMRTATDIRPSGPGSFNTYDDLLKQQVNFTLREDGTIHAVGSGLLPAQFVLLPVELSYPDIFLGELDVIAQADQLALDGLPEQEFVRPGPLEIGGDLTYPIMAPGGECLSQDTQERDLQGGALGLLTCAANDGQLFLFLDGDGLMVTQGGMCLEATGNEAGALVVSFGCDANSGQLWQFEQSDDAPETPEGVSYVGRFRNANDLCLIRGGSAAGIALGDCSLSDNSIWMLP